MKNIIESKLKESLNNIADSDGDYIEDTGILVSIKDGIAKATGCINVYCNELVEFYTEKGPTSINGMVVSLEDDHINILLLNNGHLALEGMIVKRKNHFFKIGVGKELLGRVVNGFGEPIDGKGEIRVKEKYDVERPAPGIVQRENVTRPLSTGYKAIDSTIPIGKGQRQLIIGDRKIGKSTLARDAIINQKGKNVICVYVCIGQRNSMIAGLIKDLEDRGAMKYTIIVAASASENAAMQYLAPYSGCAMAEYFRDNGQDALIVYDDLTKQAIAYRQISLILRKPPGREAFPSDIFSIHAKLLERASQLSKKEGGGSLTALPVVETQAGDIAGYIPTNVISITDGQIFLETNLFDKDIKPSINIGLSVSRIGGDAQRPVMKDIVGKLKLILSQYRDLEAFAQFGSDLNEDTKKQMKRGEVLVEVLKQYQGEVMPEEHQIVILYLAINGMLDELPIKRINAFEKSFLSYFAVEYQDILKVVQKGEKLS
ncbi:MAG: F0F1 ATP synthase subunit alpha, partial [Pseudomonadota bacterium]